MKSGVKMVKYHIQWMYKTPKKQSVLFSSDETDLETAISIGEDAEKTGRAQSLEFIDSRGTSWTLKELKKLGLEVAHEPTDVEAFFDGNYNKLSKEAGLGAVIYYTINGKRSRMRYSQKAEALSNNEAEYMAFYFLVQKLEELGVQHQDVTFKGDSQVVLNQLSGEWPCYEEAYSRWLDKIEKALNKRNIRPICVPVARKENAEADKLAGQGLSGIKVASEWTAGDQDE
ncbi:reverse transcriptase-like protein [Metabacillus sp. cB07]|uniref:reverse transcriptase-like protein n=1 Tax=Metabacillus sp. cB07 TaxID=2806989 RepID=UPI00049394FF|nr:reverse transcriptase-like protein [Metabacillus sp. cB07]